MISSSPPKLFLFLLFAIFILLSHPPGGEAVRTRLLRPRAFTHRATAAAAATELPDPSQIAQATSPDTETPESGAQKDEAKESGRRLVPPVIVDSVIPPPPPLNPNSEEETIRKHKAETFPAMFYRYDLPSGESNDAAAADDAEKEIEFIDPKFYHHSPSDPSSDSAEDDEAEEETEKIEPEYKDEETIPEHREPGYYRYRRRDPPNTASPAPQPEFSDPKFYRYERRNPSPAGEIEETAKQ